MSKPAAVLGTSAGPWAKTMAWLKVIAIVMVMLNRSLFIGALCHGPFFFAGEGLRQRCL